MKAKPKYPKRHEGSNPIVEYRRRPTQAETFAKAAASAEAALDIAESGAMLQAPLVHEGTPRAYPGLKASLGERMSRR